MRSSGWTPVQYDYDLVKRRDLDRHTQGERHPEVAVTFPQAKELPEARRQPWTRSFPSVWRGSTALLTLILDFQSPEL